MEPNECKEKLLNWLKHNNQGGETSYLVKSFENQLDEALSRLDEYYFNWQIGWEISLDGYAYQLYLDNSGCVISLLDPEIAAKVGFSPDMIEKREYSYKERSNDLVEVRENMLKWFTEQTIFNKDSEETREYTSQLDDALKTYEFYNNLWFIGRNCTKEGRHLLIAKDNLKSSFRYLEDNEAKELGFEDNRIIYQTYEYAEKPKDLQRQFDTNDQIFYGQDDKLTSEYLQKAWASISILDTNDDSREPRSKKEIDNFEYYLNLAKEQNPSDKELQDSINDFEKYLNKWQKRKFDGSKRDLVVVSFFAIMFIFGITFSTIGAIFSGGNTEKNEAGTEIVVSSNDPQANKKHEVAAEKSIDEPLNNEKKTSVFGAIIGGFLIIIFNLLFMGAYIGYYWAKKAPVWLIDKRNEKPVRRPISRFFARLTGDLATTSYVETIKYSDGSTETRTDAMSGPAMALFVWMLYYSVFLAMIPLWTGLSYLKNYVWYK